MSDKEIYKEGTEPKNIRRIGTMNTTAYQAELVPRTKDTPGIIGTDSSVMQIAKGMGKKIFNNPMELAESLQGFEQFCLDKNITPSFVALSVYLNVSKGTLLKYLKESTQYTVMLIKDNVTGDYIYSNTNKKILDKYIESYNEVDANGNSISIKSKIEDGSYIIEYRSVSFANVLSPVRSLIELATTNRAFDMKNPAFAIFLAVNKFGEVEQYTNKQEISIQATNPLDDLDDSAILKAAQSRPDDA